jgi:ATP-grasp domain-containing protein
LAASSSYIREGELAQDEDGAWPAPPGELAEAEAFLARVLADAAVPLPPAVVVDVGLIAGRGWAIVEANAAWGAGICGCAPDRLLPVLRRATRTRDAIPAADAPWLRPFAEVEG